MKPRFFKTPGEFRAWLEKNHTKEKELLVGFYKVGTGKPSITWPQSVDAALSYGWIDGIRRSVDKDVYTIRFTPRRPRSIWSTVNMKRVAELKRAGLMHPTGLAAFEARDENRSGIYSFENRPKELPPHYERQFRANKKAWEYFTGRAPSMQRTAIFWIMSAKQDETRVRRLETLIADCSKVHPGWPHKTPTK